MLSSYHNHTTWSDGKASIGAYIEKARVLGIGELGITDHLTLHPSGEDPAWAMPRHQVTDYVAEVLRYRDLALAGGSLAVRLGVEVDWFDGCEDDLRDVITHHPWDCVIGSVHFVGDFTVDGSEAEWRRLSEDEREEVFAGYWHQVALMAASGLFDVMGHLDVVKKFGFRPAGDISAVVNHALDAIASARMVVELNTAGWHKPCRDAYPSYELLCSCRKRDIPVVINADAHRPDHLLRGFRRAAERLAAAGYDHVARLINREALLEPLEEAVRGLPVQEGPAARDDS